MISENTPLVRIVNVWNISTASVISANNVKVLCRQALLPRFYAYSAEQVLVTSHRSLVVTSVNTFKTEKRKLI